VIITLYSSAIHVSVYVSNKGYYSVSYPVCRCSSVRESEVVLAVLKPYVALL
jgi:hypothetical protein